MNPDYAPGAFLKQNMATRVEEKRERRRSDRAAWAAVCKMVDQRDRGRCRSCARRCDPNAIGMLERAERHHITYRSAGGEDDAFNVVTLCAQCHSDQHAARIDVRGNAQWGIEVWAPDGSGQWYLVRRETSPGVWERD